MIELKPEDISPHIKNLKEHLNELEKRLSDPSIFSRQQEYREVSKEHQKLST